MSWTYNESLGLIMRDDNIVVGSIQRVGENWRIEIPWSTGDIVFETPSMVAAMAFIEGVEKGWAAVAAAQSPSITLRLASQERH